jgi:hypothetical protein
MANRPTHPYLIWKPHHGDPVRCVSLKDSAGFKVGRERFGLVGTFTIVYPVLDRQANNQLS